jgi:hypothetical protein
MHHAITNHIAAQHRAALQREATELRLVRHAGHVAPRRGKPGVRAATRS